MSNNYISKCLLFVFAICWQNLNGQTVLAEFELATNNIDYIQTFELKDSIFLSFAERDVKRSYWITSEGNKAEISLQIPSRFPIGGIVQEGDKMYYYYFDAPNDNLILKVLEQSTESGKIGYATPIFPIPGELLDIHVDGLSVTVVSYMRKENRLRILTLDGLRIRHDHRYEMPFDLHPHMKKNAGFMLEKSLVNINQGSKTLKLYHEGDQVVLTIDDDQPGKENSKTTIMKLDAGTGAKEVYELKRNDYDKFVSFYYKDKVYQLVNTPRKSFECNIYELRSGKIIYSKKFEKDRTQKQYEVIVRRGKSKEVDFNDLYEMINMEDTTPSILVRGTKDSTRTRLVLGVVYRYDDGRFVPIPSALGLLISSAINDIFTNDLYFTLTGSPEIGFDFERLKDISTRPLFRVIDEFEISHTSKAPKGVKPLHWSFKGYVELTDGALGIYQEAGKRLTLLKYTTDN